MTAVADRPLIYQSLVEVARSVRAVAKGDHNKQQNFNFRGIDAVLNAVGPALRDHGVIVLPELIDRTEDRYQSKNGAQMIRVVVNVAFHFAACDGSEVVVTVPGEAADSGDKAVSKAMSVALRTALIQCLALPTDEPDPDHEVHERGPAFDPAVPATWPDALSISQAKQVVLNGAHGDTEWAAAAWERLDVDGHMVDAVWLDARLDDALTLEQEGER